MAQAQDDMRDQDTNLAGDEMPDDTRRNDTGQSDFDNDMS